MTVPASVTRIGGNAFPEYTALKALQFKGTTEQWRAIEGCGTVAVPYIQCSDGGLGVQEVPAYLKLYGTKVTGYADGLPENLVIPDGVTEIGRHAFDRCTSLTSVTIPASVTSIGDYAFYNCTSLESVEIPASVTYGGTEEQWASMKKGSSIFYNTKVTEITDKGGNPFTVNTSGTITN